MSLFIILLCVFYAMVVHVQCHAQQHRTRSNNAAPVTQEEEDDDPLTPHLRILGCDQHQRSMIVDSLKEAREMLERASERLVALRTYLRLQVVPALRDQSPLLASTFRTFSSIIYQDIHTEGWPHTPQRLYAQTNVRDVYSIADSIVTALDEGYLEFSCDNDWIIRRDGLFYDNRDISIPVTQNQRWHQPTPDQVFYSPNMDNPPRACTISGLAGHYTSVICLSRFHFDSWDLPRREYGRELRPFRELQELTLAPPPEATLSSDDWHIEHLGPTYYLTATLIHELSHSHQILGLEGALVDIHLPDYGGYRWDGITYLAQHHHASASKNAQSFMYLVIALYLDKDDWSTGYSRQLQEAWEN